MTEYNKISEGVFTSTGVAKFINLPYLPNSFEIWNVTAMGTPTQNEITHAISWRSSTAGTASVEYFNATPVLTTTTLATGGISFIEAGTYQYGPTFTISGIVAATGVVTTTAAHGYAVGDTVLLYGTTGMLQIAGTTATITAVPSTTTFTLGTIPTAGFAANATAGFVKQVLYPDLYIPEGSLITGYGATVTGVPSDSTVINLALFHSFVPGQEVFFVMPTVSATVWGLTGLDTLAYNTANAIPQQAYITQTSANNSNLAAYQVAVRLPPASVSGTFAYPTSAVASLGITFPQLLSIGDQNSGNSGLIPPLSQAQLTIPGAFQPNTRKGVIIGLGNGTQVLHATSDVVRWRAIYPDQILTS